VGRDTGRQADRERERRGVAGVGRDTGGQTERERDGGLGEGAETPVGRPRKRETG